MKDEEQSQHQGCCFEEKARRRWKLKFLKINGGGGNFCEGKAEEDGRRRCKVKMKDERGSWYQGFYEGEKGKDNEKRRCNVKMKDELVN